MKPRSTATQSIGLLFWVILVFAAAAVGATASIKAGTFYAQLARPAWAPPGWIFGPVWSVLYVMMAVAAWLVWREQHPRGPSALAVFLVQLAANALWSWLFFAWHNGALAFAEVLILLVLIIATVRAFWRIRRSAGILLLPYLGWVCFASALTWAVWRSNPRAL